MPETRKKIAVLTSGGDAPGMNAAVRAVVRAGLYYSAEVYAAAEGYQGLTGQGNLRAMSSDDVGGIVQQGGTVIGTARCKAFRQPEGRQQAVYNLVRHGIDNLVVIGGDGSLTGADCLRREWPQHLEALQKSKKLSPQQVKRHSQLHLVGLVGSIDNDMACTDMTIGADSALHRVTEALDALTSTASSHQRTFVVEVMGRNCGYLALMGGIAGAADWLFIPEAPPAANWPRLMCESLTQGRAAGRRDSIIVVAEGAQDRNGQPITSEQVKQAIEEHLAWDVRVTVLGHIQRGGTTSAFDRNMAALLGFAAVEELLFAQPDQEPQMIGIRGNRVRKTSLMAAVERTQKIGHALSTQDFEVALGLRGSSFREAFHLFQLLAHNIPKAGDQCSGSPRTIAILNAGGLAPGMNNASRIAVRSALALGYRVLGIENGFLGLSKGQIRRMDWHDVAGWAGRGGSQLTTSRWQPQTPAEVRAIANHIKQYQMDGLLMIGGWDGYQAVSHLKAQQGEFSALRLPIVCLPASIDNNLPGSELSIGADTALNTIVAALDNLRQTAVANRRIFVVEVMGAHCGYLALMSGLASGAEAVYLPEQSVNLARLLHDVQRLKTAFAQGRQLGLIIRSEQANKTYDAHFMHALFSEEGQGHFDARLSILGHIQQGGDPSPFDRIQATRLADRGIQQLHQWLEQGLDTCGSIGFVQGQVATTPLHELQALADNIRRRPVQQWWYEQQAVARVLACDDSDHNQQCRLLSDF